MKLDYKNKTVLDENQMSTEELQLKFQESALVLKMDRVATQVKLASAKSVLSEAKSAYPLNVQNIINTKAEVDKYEAGIKAIDDIAKELGLRDEDLEQHKVSQTFDV